MVHDSAFLDMPYARTTPRLAEWSYVAFLLLIFVGLSPFAVRDSATLIGGEMAANGAGDVFRQFAFAISFGLIVFTAMRNRGFSAFADAPAALSVLLMWCLVSAYWSPEPAVTLRRAALETVVVLSAMMSVSTLGAERSFALLRAVLAGILVINWCSIPIIHQAVHLAGDPEPQLAGDWRGLYFHKNIAGAVSAITAILFFFSAWDKRRLADVVLCAAAVGFAVMTQSKSSLALLPVALMAGTVYRIAWGKPLDRLIVAVLFGLVLVCGAAFALINFDSITQIFTDPAGFTGRAAIWQAEIAFIKDHPALGAGFGSFADTGALSPLHNYVASNWVDAVAHGHNAYLQLLVTIGGVGFVFALFGLVVVPFVTFCRETGPRVVEMAMPFALFAFIVLHNLVESDFLEGDGPAWVAFLIMLAALRAMRAEDEVALLEPWRTA